MKILRGKKGLGGKGHYMLICEAGEEVMKCLTEVCAGEELDGAVISGLGALRNIELGAYDVASKSYLKQNKTDSDYELVSFNGNASLKEGEYFIHAHAGFAQPSLQMFGGHLFSAEVAATAEFVITPLGLLGDRQYNEEIGLDLICQIAGQS